MLNAKYESLQHKPRAVPFLSVCLQIILTYMFCSGAYTVFGQSFTLINVFSIRSALKNVTDVTFEHVATGIMSIIYIGFSFGMIFNTLISWRKASSIKKLFKEETVDVLKAKELLGKLILATRRTVFVSLVFLCWSRLLSVYSLTTSMQRNLFFILMMCLLVEAKFFSYVQGKRGAFSFGKSLCGYLFVLMLLVAVFDLKEKTVYDFAIGLIDAFEGGEMPTSTLDILYFLQANVIVYLAPLLFVLGLFRPFRLLFQGARNVAGTEKIKKAANTYLVSVLLFLITTCVLFGIHDRASSLGYYWDILSEFVLIIVFAALVKLLSIAANSRFRFPVKIMEIPFGERHTLD